MYFSKHWKERQKSFEFHAGYLEPYYRCQVFNFEVEWSKRCDHAGFHFNITLWLVFIDITFCDTRRWDYDNNCVKDYTNQHTNDEC
mgnify:CR=1 FL=1|jgi:hypothetical protein